MDEQIEGMLNAEVSMEEQRAWDMIIDPDHVEVFTPHTLHTQHDKNIGGEAGDDGSANERSNEEDENTSSHGFAAIGTLKPQGTKAQAKKPSQKWKELDCHLAALIYNLILPSCDLCKGC